MELHNLKPAEGSTKKRKRVGRGQGSTRGGTATRGHKGAQSRSGYSRKKGFEGGQMPLQRRIPKRGFKNINRVEYVAFNLDVVQRLADKHNLSDFSFDKLRELNIIGRTDKIKILGRGDINSSLRFKVHACSETAKEAIQGTGGSIELI